jgi:MraZ protein
VFQGAAALTLDAKGRLAIPSRHREALASVGNGTVVVTAHPHHCLLIYPLPAWEPIRDQVVALSSLQRQSAHLRRLLIGNAREEELDAAGRVLISPELRGYAGLEKDVFLVGQGDHFELWSETSWHKEQEDISALDYTQLPPSMENLRL